MNTPATDKYIGIDEAAEYLGISPITLRKWLKQNKELPRHQIGKFWKFKKSELDSWVLSGNSATENEQKNKKHAG